jgi:hypothetical protein
VRPLPPSSAYLASFTASAPVSNATHPAGGHSDLAPLEASTQSAFSPDHLPKDTAPHTTEDVQQHLASRSSRQSTPQPAELTGSSRREVSPFRHQTSDAFLRTRSETQLRSALIQRRSSQGPGCGGTVGVSLGYVPFLHHLRRARPFVRWLLRYYARIRLLSDVNSRVTAFGLFCFARCLRTGHR